MNPNRGGVTIPQNQGRPQNEGSPNTVVSAMRCEFVAVEYFDRNGRRVRDVLLKAGEDYYSPPDSVAWTERLKPVHQWLAMGITQKLPIVKAEKIVDKVDVLSDVGIKTSGDEEQ